MVKSPIDLSNLSRRRVTLFVRARCKYEPKCRFHFLYITCLCSGRHGNHQEIIGVSRETGPALMCGRAYTTFTDDELQIKYLNHRTPKLPPILPNYNLCPSQKTPIIFIRNHERAIDMFRWGLVPKWAKDVKAADQYKLINAKSEDIETKKSYAKPFLTQRCIVPVSGFYEWRKPLVDAGPKIPNAITLATGEIMSLAGIWEMWGHGTDMVQSFSIITTGANSIMSSIHHRMPVILDKSGEENWLNENFTDVATLKQQLVPCPDQWLKIFQISRAVNSPKNNDPSVLKPL